MIALAIPADNTTRIKHFEDCIRFMSRSINAAPAPLGHAMLTFRMATEYLGFLNIASADFLSSRAILHDEANRRGKLGGYPLLLHIATYSWGVRIWVSMTESASVVEGVQSLEVNHYASRAAECLVEDGILFSHSQMYLLVPLLGVILPRSSKSMMNL